MRLISFLTAFLVASGLYLIVMERDLVLAFAGVAPGDAAADAPSDAAADTPNTALDTPAPAPEAARVAVVAIESAEQALAGRVLLRGRTEAARRVEVRAETSGLVISEPLQAGTRVAAGDVLCQLDPGPREARLAEAESRLTGARAGLSEAQISYDAAAGLSAGGFASQTRLASAEAGLEGARAALAAAEAGLAGAREEIARLTLRAPFDGVLNEDSAELGALLQPGGLCARVLALDPIRLVGYVDETALPDVAPGAAARARLVGGQMLEGTVRFVAMEADQTTRTFRVEIESPNPDLAIRDGQSADITITGPAQMAHLLPQSALTLDEAGRLGVRLADETGHARFAPVRVLRDSAEGMWLAGLPARAEVIVVGQEFAGEGAALEISRPSAPSLPGAPLQ